MIRKEEQQQHQHAQICSQMHKGNDQRTRIVHCEQEESGITNGTKICANIGVQLHRALFFGKVSTLQSRFVQCKRFAVHSMDMTKIAIWIELERMANFSISIPVQT